MSLVGYCDPQRVNPFVQSFSFTGRERGGAESKHSPPPPPRGGANAAIRSIYL